MVAVVAVMQIFGTKKHAKNRAFARLPSFQEYYTKIEIRLKVAGIPTIVALSVDPGLKPSQDS
jgi:hypothetical protein